MADSKPIKERSVKFTQKNYKLIASAINAAYHDPTWHGAAPQDIPVIKGTLHFVAQHVARTLKRNDPKLDHVKFFIACINDETEDK
jgi:hypothetical protein